MTPTPQPAIRGPHADAAATAQAAAQAAGTRIAQASTGPSRIHHKGAVDLVTEVDLACEREIRSVLAERSPGVPVQGEEEGGDAHAGLRWVVDPLDGTTNFVHGFPSYGVSVALVDGGRPIAGCVHDAVHHVSHTAARGGGAWVGPHRMAVSDTRTVDQALLCTGFPYDRRTRADHYLRFVEAMLRRAQGLRRAGAAAIDLVHVAAGRADGFWEFGLAPWDVAAGWLLVEEAGGRVTDVALGPLDLAAPRLLASNGWLHQELAEILATCLSEG